MSETLPKILDSTEINLPERAHFPLLNDVVPVILGIALSASMELIIIVCTWKLYLKKKKAKRAELPSLSGTNHLYYGPIYETIKEADDELKVEMANNDAYQDIRPSNKNSLCKCGTDVINKDTFRIQMENNNSYQAITSPVIVNSEVSTSKQPCCYKMPLKCTLENTQRLNNMYTSQEDNYKTSREQCSPNRNVNTFISVTH